MLLGNILFSPAGVILVDVDGGSVTLIASDALWVAEEIERHRKELQRALETAAHVAGEPSATGE